MTIRHRKLREESLINTAPITQGLERQNIVTPRKTKVEVPRCKKDNEHRGGA